MLSKQSKPNLAALAQAGVWAILWALVYASPINDFLVTHVSRPLEFRLRSLLQKGPELDARLKVYAFDEQTLSYLGYNDLTLAGWSQVISQFARSKPKAIYIDKIFSIPLQEKVYDSLRPEQAKAFIEGIRALDVPIIVGGFISPSQIPGRKLMSLFHQDYSFALASGFDRGKEFSQRSWPAIEQGYFYGPHPLIRDAFHVGHITNIEFGYAKPYFRIDPTSLIPHAALLAMGPLRIDNDQIRILDQAIPMNSRNNIILNFSNRETYYSRTKSLLHTIMRINRNEPEPQVTGEDIVVILPAMFTGHTDFKDTPVGRLQGGYFGVTLMNSVLTRSWLHESPAFDALLVFGSLLLCIMAVLFVRPLLCIGVLLSCLGLIPLLGTSLFVYLGLSCSWLLAAMASSCSGLMIFVEKLRHENYRSQSLLATLRGALSPELADSIARNPNLLQGDPVEQIVTIMFVDIVGFSLTTERQTPKAAFGQLKGQLHFMVEKIHEYGGLVDKSLGDGVLCFFGYHYQENQVTAGHADRALMCAIEIQKEAQNRAVAMIAAGQPIYPLRIGINTATVYLGNLGTEGRIDFTLIGNGVNLTARLEHACAPYRIMLGLATYDLLAQFTLNDPHLSSKSIRIKHHKKLMKCFEYDPFVGKEHETREILRYYRMYHSLSSQEPRWYLDRQEALIMDTQFGQARLLNFSSGGVALVIDQQLSPGTIIHLSLAMGGRAKPMLTIAAEVCWSRADLNNGNLHGCQFYQVDAPYADAFVLNLRQHLKASGKTVQSVQRSSGESLPAAS